jgi:predicted nucleic-acid-binding protein
VIALDTNVLVRFLVADDAEQHRQAVASIERALASDAAVLITSIVLVETVWVLRRSYRLTRAEIAAVLHRLLSARQLELHGRDQVVRSLRRFEAGKGDFADYMIAEQAAAKGAEVVVTFDQALMAEQGFAPPQAA